ncbi:MAG: UvrD-helicase domain-containing protein [Longimicrobiales bacterium]|nr:UvrD-helicase domain-containing protein [Longimicrobiales bacterium]
MSPDTPPSSRGVACELILASAGSGKTYQISSRIIAALADGVPARSIFASTFTRAAAGEILDRVLTRLAGAAVEAEEARALTAEVRAILSTAPPSGRGDPDRRASTTEAEVVASSIPDDPEAWQHLLARTMRRLREFEVGTLDSFFQRVARSFGHELELPPGWSVAELPELEDARAAVLDEVLGRADTGSVLQLVRDLHGGEARRSVHRALVSTVEALIAIEHARAPEAPGWDAAVALTGGESASDAVIDPTALRRRWIDAPLAQTRAGKDHVAWARARDQAIEAIEAGAWDDFASRGFFKAIAATPPGVPPTYAGRTIEPALIEIVRDTARLAAADLSRVIAARGAALGRLARDCADAWTAQIRGSGRVGFDDVARHLAGSDPPSRRADFGARLGGEVRHLLLDEFQDTSLLQWEVLAPLLQRVREGEDDEEAADGGRRVTVVADPKQSIYGWRGGAPIVVRELEERWGFTTEAMTGSYRSSRPVLEAVNRVFDGIESSEVMAGEARDAGVVAEWARDFGAHEVRLRPDEASRPGEAVLRSGPPLEVEGGGEDLNAWAAEEIARLAAACEGRTIGVLVRTNAAVARFVVALQHRGVPVSEEGGTRIVDAPAVVALLSLLHLVDHPGDGLARWHLASTPLGGVVGLVDHDDEDAVRRVTTRLRRRLADEGFGGVLTDLEAALDTASPHGTRDRQRIRQLVALGHAFDAALSPGVRTDRFIRLALQHRAELPGREPVRVMTVHRSKGLEFDVVVLPDLGKSIFAGGRRAPAAYTWRPGGHGPITHVFPAIPSWQAALFDEHRELGGAIGQHREGEMRDVLGTLYVGMTRARHALHMLIPEDPEGKDRARSPARFLVERLAGERLTEGYRSGEILWSTSTDTELGAWHHQVERAGGRSIAPTRLPPRIDLRKEERSRILDRRSPSSGVDATRLEPGRILTPGDDSARDHGTLVHAWLEDLRWIDGGLPPGDELARGAQRGLLEGRIEVGGAVDAPTLRESARWLAEKLDAPAIRDALSRERYPADADVHVESEYPFLWKDAARGLFVEGVIDRLVVVEEGGEISSVEILDFKTDRIRAGETGALAGRVAHHAPQIQRYREAIASIFELDPGAIRGTLLFLDPGEAVEVPPA